MYGNNKIFSGNPESLIDTQKEKYSGFDPAMTNGDSMSILTLKRTYLKMTNRAEDIGWDEMIDELSNTLAQIMGDNEFVEWNNEENKE